MKIYGGWSSAGWYAACVMLCVYTHPVRDRPNERYVSSSRSFDPKSADNDYDFEEELSATKLSAILEDSLEEFEEEKGPSAMRAITTRSKSNPVLLPLIIEPEAEMLPHGYKGVKSPGVTHMELALAKPQVGPLGRKSATLRASATDDEDPDKSHGFDAHYAASKHEMQIARDDRDGDNLVILEIRSKGDSKKESEKAEYTEATGARKSHSENEDRAKNHKEEIAEKKGDGYEAGDSREKAHNTAGYRNVYHKDEFKKDAGFYDNGRQGGHFEKHGRYAEKHGVAEGTYAKVRKSPRLVEVEANEREKFEKTRADREAQGRVTMDSSGTWTDS